MQELRVSDSGGASLPPGEITTDEFIAYVSIDNFNPDLMDPAKDPYATDAYQLLNEINNAAVVTVDIDQLSTGKFEGVNFNDGEDQSKFYRELKPGFAGLQQLFEQQLKMKAAEYYFSLNNSNSPFASKLNFFELENLVDNKDDEFVPMGYIDPCWESDTPNLTVVK